MAAVNASPAAARKTVSCKEVAQLAEPPDGSIRTITKITAVTPV